MKVEYIFMDEYTPKERRNLLMKEYVRKGLSIFGGHRKQTAKFLGIAPRTLRVFMANNPELREEFPAHTYEPQPYKAQEKSPEQIAKARRNYKSLLKYKYKIKGITFNSLTEIAVHYSVALRTVEYWVKNKITPDKDVVRVISIPINWDGSEYNN